jgi:hypothetical protein
VDTDDEESDTLDNFLEQAAPYMEKMKGTLIASLSGPSTFSARVKVELKLEEANEDVDYDSDDEDYRAFRSFRLDRKDYNNSGIHGSFSMNNFAQIDI